MAYQPQQVIVPYPPEGDAPGKRLLRERPDVSVQDSYRLNIIRVTVPGGSTIDVGPAAEDQASSVSPAAVFGVEPPVWIVSGCNAFGRLATQEEQESTTEVLHEALELMGWTWYPVVLMAPGREWVETGAVVMGPSRDEIVSKALYHGQEAVLLWDEDGISVIATGLADDVVDGPPVAVAASPASLGCPMMFGTDVMCVRPGGPFGHRAMQVGLAWELHRGLLVSALGCTVCEGGAVHGHGRPIALVSSFVPSRRGGWQWGPPLPATVDDSGGEDG
jgi:hypothetical protein